MKIDWADLQGALVLARVHDTHHSTVVVLDGEREGSEYAEAAIHPKGLQKQLQMYVGGWVVGRVRNQTLTRATEADRRKTRRYLATTWA